MWKRIKNMEEYSKTAIGPVCEREYLKNIYNNQQITTDFILKDKKRER